MNNIHKKPKIEIKNSPEKCRKCAYRKPKIFLDNSYCIVQNKKIEDIDPHKIEICKEMEQLLLKRQQFKTASWSKINQTLLKLLLEKDQSNLAPKLILDNYGAITSNFKIWEILTMLSFSTETTINDGVFVSPEDYLALTDKYFLFIETLHHQEKIPYKTLEDSTPKCDYATLVLLRNFLVQRKTNTITRKLLNQIKENNKTPKDAEEALEIIYKEGLLQRIRK